MNALILLPSLICLFFVVTGRVKTAFLSVYLPTLFLLPQSYAIRIPHLPPVSASEAAVIPLGMVAFYRLVFKNRPLIMDFLVYAFMAGLVASEVLKEHVLNDGIFMATSSFISIFLPYAVGRTMIEPELRLTTVRRIVLLALLLGIPGAFEWRFGQNIYGPIGQKILGTATSTTVQLRGARGRFAAAFSDAEIAGIAIAMTAALNSWLARLWKTGAWKNAGTLFSTLEKYHIAGILLFGYIFLTQSRGPLLAVMVGYLILQIPRFKNTKLATGAVAIIIAVGTVGAYFYFARSTNMSDPSSAASEQQASTQYRFRMNELYKPIAEEGGWLGSGIISHPSIPGMLSIDNEFLLIHVSQGELGYLLYILIAVESVRTLVVRSWRPQANEDRAFLFSMLAAMVIFWFSVTTVYMGEQLPQVAFLMIGWGRSIVPRAMTSTAIQENATPAKFNLKRIFK